MKIGIVSEGQSEVDALPKLFPAFQAATGNSFLRPIRTSVHPTATFDGIAYAAAKQIEKLLLREPDVIVFLLDREQRTECPGELAARIHDALHQSRKGLCPIQVVVKDRTFENWLISDVAALATQRGRFDLPPSAARSVVQSGADGFDALAVLKQWTAGRPYRKADDSIRILDHADPLRMAATSRSFRRFLRCVGHPAYAQQSRHPLPHQ